MSVGIDERVADEIEALEAILMDDVVITRIGDIPDRIVIVLHPSTGDDLDRQFVCVTLDARLSPDYPDSSPEVRLRNPRGLDDHLLADIHTQIQEKLADCIGQPVIFELIELIRENLTEWNLPSGQCAICLYGFANGDVFIRTQCYHYFHNHCLASHFIASRRNHQEERDRLPAWQQSSFMPYRNTCPVCRNEVRLDVEALRNAPPPVSSFNAAPFRLTDELKDLQLKMAALLAQQIAKGGVIGFGDTGPPPLTITTPEDNEIHDEATNDLPGASNETAKASGLVHGRQNGNGSNDNSTPGSPARAVYRGPYRGFNRRGKPGRRGRGAR